MKLVFPPYEIDLQLYELRCNGCKVTVEPKAFDLLVFLIANRERVVTRQELFDNLWPDRVASDASLDTCVRSARRAVGDSANTQLRIRTLVKRGYQFVAEIGLIDRNGRALPNPGKLLPAPSCEPGRDNNPVREEVPPPLPAKPSIVVLPFDDLTPNVGQSALAIGLRSDITTLLGRTRWLFVIARASAAQLINIDPMDAGAKVGVRYVLQCSIHSQPPRFRVRACLIDAVERTDVWSETFDRSNESIFAVQDEISEAIARHVAVEVEAAERQRALLKPIAHLDAWSAYHRGCWHLDRHTQDGYDRAEHFLSLAAKLDPYSARVLASLSYVHRQRVFLGLTADRAGGAARAFELARHALSLDMGEPQAHWVLGRAHMLKNEVESALVAFEAAARLNPSFAIGHYSVGFAKSMLGMPEASDEALTTARRLSPIDPLSYAMLATAALNAAASGDHDRAINLLDAALTRPNSHHHIHAFAALCNALAGRRAAAEHHLQHVRSARPSYSAQDLFNAYPFQSERQMALWRKAARLIGMR